MPTRAKRVRQPLACVTNLSPRVACHGYEGRLVWHMLLIKLHQGLRDVRSELGRSWHLGCEAAHGRLKVKGLIGTCEMQSQTPTKAQSVGG